MEIMMIQLNGKEFIVKIFIGNKLLKEKNMNALKIFNKKII